MVYEYGMGTSIRSHQVPADDYSVSESLRRTRDEEVEEISEEAYRGAYRLLVDHRDLLDDIAERLLANEVIEHGEIREIMEQPSGDGRLRELAEQHEAARLSGDRAEALASDPGTNRPRSEQL
jgi:cell division protease FtsH